MKRIFLIAVAFVLLVGCDKYDDSQLKEAISKLEDRVLALEKLNDDVAALKEIVEGKVTVASCVEEDGVWTVTLSDGKSFEVHPAVETPDIPVITVIKDEDGRSYWGYYENDKVEYLLHGDNKIEVTTVVPSIRINDDNHLEISVDGGKTWVESKEELVSGTCLFSGIEQKEDCVVLTLADGFTQYTVPLLKEVYQQFVSFSGKQYFTNGETKNIAIEMVGVDNYTITEKPEGWKAVLSEGQLTVTAPAKGTGDTEGYIKMIGVGTETSIASVYVTIGTAPCVITISDTRQVKIKASSGSFFYGASTLEEFDPAALAKELGEVTNFMLARHPFSSNVDVPLAELVPEVVPGETYVVWALPITGYDYAREDVHYQAVSSIGVTSEVSDVTFENANIYVNVKGTDTYYLIPLQEDMTIDTCIEDLNGNYAATYNVYRHNSSFMGRLTDLVSAPIAGESYNFLVLPVKLGALLKADAVTFAVRLNAYTRGGSLNLKLSEVKREYRSLTVNVSADNNAYRTFIAAVSEAEYISKGYSDDNLLLDYLSSQSGRSYSAAYDFVADNLQSGASYYIVAVAMDRKGIMGAPERLVLSTKAVVPSDVTISVSDVNASLNSATVYISADGEVAGYRYMFMAGDGADYWYYTYQDNDTAAYEALVYGTCTYVDKTAAEVAAGISFTDLQFGVGYIFRVIGYDKEGRVTALAKADISTTVGAVTQKSNDRWTAMKPDVTTVVTGNSMKLSISFPQGCKSYAVTKMSSEEFTAACPSAARLRTDYILKHGYVLRFTENISGYIPAEWYISADRPYVLVTWEDESGWYEPLVIDSATGQPIE